MLKPKKKLKVTKKDLKEDKFVLTVFKVQEFLNNNVKLLSIAVVAIVLVIALFTFISKDQAKRERTASLMIAKAVMDMENGNIDKAVADFNIIIEKYDDTDASIYANLKMAEKCVQENDYAKAKPFYENVINDGGNIDFILASGYAGVADCNFNEEKYEEAAEFYKKAAHAVSSNSQKAEYLFSAAITYKKIDDLERTKKVLKSITENYSDTRINEKAEKILAAMK